MKGKYIAKILKKSACFFLSTSLCIGLVGFTGIEARAAQFNDVQGHWAEASIRKASNLGIINGYTDGSFRPNASVTRAEFAGMVNRTLGNLGTNSISFPDVSTYEWYYNDVAKAVSATYVAGYADGYFKPKNPISRQEAAVMISRLVPSSGYEQSLNAYPDSNSVASWAYEAMTRIVGKGYIGPYKNDNRLHPSDPLTRAQTAKILCDIKERESIQTSDPLIKSNNQKYSNTIFVNNVTIHKDLGNGSASLENCVVLGTLNIEGGGSNTVTANNSRIANCTSKKTSGQKVRLLARGSTTITNLSGSGDGILETTGLGGGDLGKGFSKVNLGSNSDFEFRGSFPSVNLDGTNAIARLESGTFDDLKITSSGRGSKVYTTRGTTIKTSEVNASSTFYGSGTIDYMRVNSNGVTYETKPRSLSVASGIGSPSEDDGFTDGVKFSPSRGSSDVGINTSIIITFETAMRLYNGSNITSSDIPDFVTLRTSSQNGTSQNIYGTINSSKREITINPSRSLEKDTRYYITIDRNALKDADGYGNSSISSYFYTGTGTSSSSAPFYPTNGDSNVPLDSDITLNFKSEVIRYNNGATISNSDSYLQECINFSLDGADGESVPFSARINSDKTSISISPNKYLLPGRTYYVGILNNKLKYATDGSPVTPGNATWTTAGTPVLSNFNSTEAGEAYINVSGSSSVNGTLYVVATAPSEAAPTANQIVSGRNTFGANVPSSSVYIRSGNSGTARISGLTVETSYTIYGVIRDSAGNNSPVVSTVGETSPNFLAGIRVFAQDGSALENFTFNPATLSYGNGETKLFVPNGTEFVSLQFDTRNNPNAIISVPNMTNGQVKIVNKSSNDLGILDLNIQFQSASGKTPINYTIRLYEKGSTEITGIDINVDGTNIESLFRSGSDQKLAQVSNATTPPNIYLNVLGAEVGSTVVISDASNKNEIESQMVTAAYTPTFTDFHFTNLSIDENNKGVIGVTITSKDGVTTRYLQINVDFSTTTP